MLFNSYLFVLFFLPLTLLVYFGINKYSRKEKLDLWWLFLMSLWFYGFANPEYLLLILGSIGVNYLITGSICRCRRQEQQKKAKHRMVAGVCFNLALLLFFKYFDFFMSNLNPVLEQDWAFLNLVLPVGISFVTFKQISYVVDCYREEEPEQGFIEYAVYVSFFPQLMAGPIAYYSEVIPQLKEKERKKVNYDNLSQGLYGLALGLGKKVLLADNLAKIADAGYANLTALNGISVVMVMIAYTLQIYFDFSGYCDMAFAMCKMMNLDSPINFNSPYKARTVGEFWDRWHMSLGRFFTKYVYIPLGGSRAGRLKTYRNKMIVFLLSGFWHGANWTFFVWGLLHGVFSAMELLVQQVTNRIKRKKPAEPLSKAAKLATTIAGRCYIFLFCNATWAVFRASSMEEVRLLFSHLAVTEGGIAECLLTAVEDIVEIRLLYRLGLGGVMEAVPWLSSLLLLGGLLWAVYGTKNTQEKMAIQKYGVVRGMVTVFLIVWSVISLSDVSKFLYSNF